MLNAKDLINDIKERAREKQVKAAKRTNESRANTDDERFSSAEPKRQPSPIHESKEIADLAGVSKTTVMRAKN